MMLNAGVIPLLDHDGKEITGVSGNYFNLFSAAFTTCGQVINLPSQAVGKKGFMVVKTTCIRGYSYQGVANGAALNRTWWAVGTAKRRQTGAIVNSQHEIATLPSTMIYEEYNTGSKGWHTTSTRYKIEILIYY